MRVKLFRATTMADALHQLRSDFGADALILSTRKLSDGMEITAAIENAPSQMFDVPFGKQSNLKLLNNLLYHDTPSHLAHRLATGELRETLSVIFKFGSIFLKTDDRPVIFVGPPGGGKTLTVVRLATRLVLSGIRPFIITADNKKAGAAEQIAAFMRVLGLDLVVASQPLALANALARREAGTPVLIDMPGGNPFDVSQKEELAAMTATANGRVAVVLPAGLNSSEAREIAASHANSGAEYLVSTRLDVSRRIGCVLAAASSGLTLVEAGIGEGAADGLVAMTADLLAKRLLITTEQEDAPN